MDYIKAIGLFLIILGVLLLLGPKIGFFRLPGDILIKRPNIVIYIPIISMIILSLILTLLLNLIMKR